MVPTERAALQFFILILCTINGLHSYPPNHPSLGILNELIGTDSKSPLIVVVDSNNQVKTSEDEPDQAYGRGHGQGHSKSCPNHPDHEHKPRQNNYDHSSPKLSNQDYEAALYELLRTSQKLIEDQERNGKSGNKDSCEGQGEKNKPSNQEFLAEQCSQSGDSCGNFDNEPKC